MINTLESLENLIAGRIKGHRKRLKLSQEALALRAGLTLRGYQDIEYAVSPPSIATLKRLASAVDVDPSALLAEQVVMVQPSAKEALEIVKNALEQAEKRERELSASARSIVDLLPALDQAKLTDSLLTYVQSLVGTGPDPLEKGRALLGSDQPSKKRRDHCK